MISEISSNLHAGNILNSPMMILAMPLKAICGYVGRYLCDNQAKQIKICHEIKHNNIVNKTPESMWIAIAKYFLDLHTPSDTSKFDDQTLNEVKKSYDEIKTSVQN